MHDPDDHRIIERLIELLGQHECLSLGFIVRDDNATLHVSAKGLGYLLDVLAAELNSLHEAYAAGYDQGYTQARDGY